MTERDPALAYNRALTAYGAMIDELRESFKDVLTLLPGSEEQTARLERAFMGVWAARALLDLEQYKRIESIVVNEQAHIGQLIEQVDKQLIELTHHVDSIDSGARYRDQKLDQIIALLTKPQAAEVTA